MHSNFPMLMSERTKISGSKRQQTSPEYTNNLIRFSRNKQSSILSKSQHVSYIQQYTGEDENQFPKTREPYFIQKDKEVLQDEILKLKIQNNKLRNDFQSVKLSNQMLEREINRLKIILDECRVISSDFKEDSINFATEKNILLQKMRFKYRELKRNSELKDKQLEQIKKNLKFSKISEMEVEIEFYKAECIRLRKDLECQINLNQFFISNLETSDSKYVTLEAKIFENLMKDNKSMFAQLKELQKQIRMLHDQLNNLCKEKNLAQVDAYKYQRQLIEKENELSIILKRVDELENQNAKAIINQQKTRKNNDEKQYRVEEALNRKLLEKDTEVERLNQLITQQQKRLIEVEYHLRQLESPEIKQKEQSNSQIQQSRNSMSADRSQQQYLHQLVIKNQEQTPKQRITTYKKIVDQKEQHDVVAQKEENLDQILTIKEILGKQSIDSQEEQKLQEQNSAQKKIHQQQQQSKSLQQTYQNEVRSTVQYQMQRKRQQFLSQYENAEQYFMNNDLHMRNAQKWQKRLRKVNYDDVEKLGRLIKFRLMSKGIDFTDMEQHIVPDEMKEKQTMSLVEIEFLLQQQPFELTVDQARLMSRYLTEDNTDEYIYFDEEKTQEQGIIKSVFRKVIGKYKTLSPEEREQAKQDTKEIIGKFKQSLIDTISIMKTNSKPKSNKSKDSEMCTFEEFQAALKFCDLNLSAQNLEFLQLISFEISNNVSELNYGKVLNYFNV